MTHGSFIWADLSTFRPATTLRFYQDLFDWRIDPGDYAVAQTSAAPVAGIYLMPDRFAKMGMPSFWMSYIAVDSVAQAVDTARALGGRVELGPADFEGGGQYALIRDPLGAGFTVYQGDALQGGGNRLGHALFVSDASAVIPFYQGLFGWDISGSEIRAKERVIAHLYEEPDAAKRGTEQYWAVLFAGRSDRIAALGGAVIGTTDLHQGTATLAQDPDGAAFLVLDTPPERNAPDFPQFAWAGLAVIILGIALDWPWLWAGFFAVWAIKGVRDGATYLLQPILRDTHPVLFWATICTWIAIAALYLLPLG